MADPKFQVVVRWADDSRTRVEIFYVREIEFGMKNAGMVDIAAFPVTARYTENEQRKRAREYCDYVNKLDEAVQEATKRITLVTAITQRLNEANSESE